MRPSAPRSRRGVELADLERAATLESWPAPLRQAVVRGIAHVDPELRRAAYRALASRDAATDDLALLVHAAPFDADATVRAFSR